MSASSIQSERRFAEVGHEAERGRLRDAALGEAGTQFRGESGDEAAEMFQRRPPPPIRLRPIWVVVAAAVLAGLLLYFSGVGWGIFLSGAGLLAFVVVTWRDSRPRGGRLTEADPDLTTRYPDD